MIKSMTGFGKQSFTCEGKSVTVEIRTLNSKQIDLNTRITSFLRDKEMEVRAIVAKSLERGKIDLSITVEKTEAQSVSINYELAKQYYELLTQLSEELRNPIPSDLFVQTLRMPDVVSTTKEDLSDEFWHTFITNVEQTCALVNDFRIVEGTHLEKDFRKRVLLVESMIEEITPYEENRIVNIRKKLTDALELSTLQGKYDPNRFEQEVIFYLEKLDITEEKVRLKKHCQYFIVTLDENDSNGKKLGFILQEMGREVNTIGSKCNDFNIQKIVVRMKDEVEKMKEQLANIL